MPSSVTNVDWVFKFGRYNWVITLETIGIFSKLILSQMTIIHKLIWNVYKIIKVTPGHKWKVGQQQVQGIQVFLSYFTIGLITIITPLLK